MSGFNLKRVGTVVSLVLATLSLSACWSDPVGPTTCLRWQSGLDASPGGFTFWQSGYAQPITFDGGWWYDGWGNPIGWSRSEDSDVCVVLSNKYSPTVTDVVVVDVGRPPVRTHSNEEVSE